MKMAPTIKATNRTAPQTAPAITADDIAEAGQSDRQVQSSADGLDQEPVQIVLFPHSDLQVPTTSEIVHKTASYNHPVEQLCDTGTIGHCPTRKPYAAIHRKEKLIQKCFYNRSSVTQPAMKWRRI
jgi:hypothetical protein